MTTCHKARRVCLDHALLFVIGCQLFGCVPAHQSAAEQASTLGCAAVLTRLLMRQRGETGRVLLIIHVSPTVRLRSGWSMERLVCAYLR